MTTPNVRFPRPIVQGTQGKDVIAHKRALARAAPTLYPWHSFSDYAGGRFMKAVVQWKVQHHLNSLPKLGKTAHELLERTHSKTEPDTWAFDPLAVKLAQDYYDAFTASAHSDRIRKAGVDAGFFWYGHRMGIAYSMDRPFQLGKPIWVPSKWDCSAFYTACCFAGGAPDPNGRAYDHLGYTGTLIDHGKKVADVTDLKPLDAIFYGHSPKRPGFNTGDPTHVVMYVGVFDGRHMVLSNGHHPMGFYDIAHYRTDLNHFRHYDI